MCIRAMLLAIVLCMTVGTASAQSPASAEATAARVLDHLDAGDYAAVTATFDARMSAALDADALRAVRAQMEAAGPVTSREAPRVSQQQGMMVVVTRIHRAQASLDATVAIDADGRVAGLHFAPAVASP
ncbi:hypothetical protein CMZ84_08510 [Lysobacteraceae bacterium NML93-0399]|nr:hypothetical protein CMZ84_08510 [Xanthomonadaceae bacterium NML93-0399]